MGKDKMLFKDRVEKVFKIEKRIFSNLFPFPKRNGKLPENPSFSFRFVLNPSQTNLPQTQKR